MTASCQIISGTFRLWCLRQDEYYLARQTEAANGLPVGMRQIGTTGKIPVHANRKSSANCGRPVPARGAVARRHERGTGCGGRKSVGAPWMSRGEMNLVS